MSRSPRLHPLVLVVDDDFVIRRSIAELLEAEGYRVVSAASGRDALAYLHTHGPACTVILLDVRMPDINGVQFRQLQQADPALAHIPVVVCSAHLDHPDIALLHPAEVLPKPFRAEQLLGMLGRYCGAEPPTEEPTLREREVGEG